MKCKILFIHILKILVVYKYKTDGGIGGGCPLSLGHEFCNFIKIFVTKNFAEKKKKIQK